MGKQKTHRGTAKRFKKTGNGKIKGNKAYANHLLTQKSQKRKRNFRKSLILNKKEADNVKKLLNLK